MGRFLDESVCCWDTACDCSSVNRSVLSAAHLLTAVTKAHDAAGDAAALALTAVAPCCVFGGTPLLLCLTLAW